jgi:hypothetical protein
MEAGLTALMKCTVQEAKSLVKKSQSGNVVARDLILVVKGSIDRLVLRPGRTSKHVGLYCTGPLCAASFSSLHQLQGHPCCISVEHEPRAWSLSVSEGGKLG